MGTMEHSDGQNTTNETPNQQMDHGPDRVNRRTYRESLRWITFASLKGLAPCVGKDPSLYPGEIVLDDQLLFEDRFPSFWANPRQDSVGPLNPVSQNHVGQRNGFFQAVRDWRPPASVAALQLRVRYSVEAITDDSGD